MSQPRLQLSDDLLAEDCRMAELHPARPLRCLGQRPRDEKPV
jgi:hypothetical protein